MKVVYEIKRAGGQVVWSNYSDLSEVDDVLVKRFNASEVNETTHIDIPEDNLGTVGSVGYLTSGEKVQIIEITKVY